MAATDPVTRLRRLQPLLLSLCDVLEALAHEIGAVTDADVAATRCLDCERRRTARTQAMRRYRAGKRDIAA
jgi:hypothetical protein